MSTVKMPKVQRLVLYGVDWRTYGRWLRARGPRRGLRLTYDRGVLEFMTLTFGHENWAHFLGRLVIALTEVLGLPIAGGGSTTFRRRKKQLGMEPDECFWIANESRVRGKERLNLRVDPPPDLAIEVDIYHSSLDRMGIYAAIGVAEVWRFDGTALSFNGLGADGKYTITAASLAFPGLTAADLTAFLILHGQLDENALLRQFRSWVQQHLGAGSGPTP